MKHSSRPASRIALAILAVTIGSPALSLAQGVLAEIHGIVTDSTGSAIPSATIVLTDVTKGWTRTIKSNAQGEYTLPELETDRFALTVDAPGFRKSIRQGIQLQTGQQARVDFSLLNGEASDSVTVEADASLVQSSDATLGDVVDQRKIVELPLNGRQFFQLAQLVPNVLPPIPGSSLAFRGGFNVSGQPEVNNNYLLDGIDNADEATMQPTVSPSVEGIQEFKLLTGVYTAEYGRFSGGQILITTRSGGNAIHGSAYEFYRNSFLDAKQYFAPGSVPSFTRNQYGVAIGGPIVKDHTFYFGTYEGLRLNQPVNLAATVPTNLERRGIFTELSTPIKNPQTGVAYTNNTLPTIDPVSLQLLQYFPTPTAGGVSNNYSFSEIRTQRQDQFSIRVDQTLWAKNTIFAAYQYQNLNAFEPSNSLCGTAQIPNFGCNTPELDQAIAIHDTQIVGSNMVNEFRIGYNRIRTNRALEDAKYGNVLAQLGIPTTGANGVGDQTGLNMGVPRVTISGYAALGGATNLPQGRRDNTYNLIDSFSWVKGKHAFKFGADYKHFIYNLQYYQDGRGIFNFNGQYTGQALADFLLGDLQATTRDPGDPGVHSFTTSSDFFVLDQYQVSKKLTLTYGIRYELDFPEGEKNNRIASYDPTTGSMPVADGRLLNFNTTTGQLVSVGSNPLIGKVWNTRYTNVAPRISLSYQPLGPKTTIRAGYGLFYNQVTAGNGISQLWRGLPFRTLQTVTNPNGTTYPKPNPIATWTAPFPAAGASAGSYSPNGINVNYHTAYVQQWNLAIDRELSKDLALEISYLGSHGSHLQESFNVNQPTPAAGTVQSRRPFSQWGPITYVDSTGGSSYNSLSAQVTRRYSAGMTLLASYTYSHSLDDAPYSGSLQNFRNLASQWASSDYDIRQRAVASFTYELPFGTKKPIGATLGALPRAAISGWQVNGILSFNSGLPFTVTTTKDPGNVGLTSGSGGYANLVPNQPFYPANKTPLNWFNTAAFTGASITPAGTYALGNSGRNMLTGGGYEDLDFGVYRNIPIHNQIHVELRAEIFNALNHPSFGTPTSSIDSSSAGAFSNTTSTARQTQFAAKVLF
ncbi:carboxypeptidase regulatory-like domain-containing protein [Granulicella sp. WH15]|uniref:TonB-dependent receptor n=1 Tax=Granulicella sp. WH15 TaxID=2602070 RepID=UPI00136690D8|nr:carboxypeptidase-like regulatory domain-containing protein [Granulicella sp. WH15]QHN04332.1 carboxypeptidase regulatory-like domain-containing protein [Granulicella sp. WH15]